MVVIKLQLSIPDRIGTVIFGKGVRVKFITSQQLVHKQKIENNSKISEKRYKKNQNIKLVC
jgi:hypothetical protein